MIIELAIHNIDIKDIDIKNIIKESLVYEPEYISVFSYYIKYVKKIIGSHPTQITCPIDLPFGMMDTNTRQQEILLAIKNGAKKIDIVFPTSIVLHRKYDKLRQDIKTNLSICQDHNISLNYMLEYRLFDHNILSKTCDILLECGVNTIYPSTGYMIDDINDNVIACAYLSKKTGIKPIANGNIWKRSQIQMLSNPNNPIYGIRCHNLRSLTMLYENTTEKEQ